MGVQIAAHPAQTASALPLVVRHRGNSGRQANQLSVHILFINAHTTLPNAAQNTRLDTKYHAKNQLFFVCFLFIVLFNLTVFLVHFEIRFLRHFIVCFLKNANFALL